jgi:hypothetical protein
VFDGRYLERILRWVLERRCEGALMDFQRSQAATETSSEPPFVPTLFSTSRTSVTYDISVLLVGAVFGLVLN